MTFLHNNCEFEISSLEYLENKSSYKKIWKYFWKIKPISLEWNWFNLTEVKWEMYKITYNWNLDLRWNEKIEILNSRFAWIYKVKEIRKHDWIKLKTTKILIFKV